MLPGEALAGFYGATTEFASDAAATDAVRSAAASRLARCAPERARNAPGTRARVRAGGVRACALRCPALIPVLSCAGRVLRSRTGEDALETLRTSREVCAQRSRLPFPRSCGSSRLRRSDPADPRIRNMLCFCPLLWRWLAGGSSATTELAHTCARTTHLRRSAAHGGCDLRSHRVLGVSLLQAGRQSEVPRFLKLPDTWEPRIAHNETPKYAWLRRTGQLRSHGFLERGKARLGPCHSEFGMWCGPCSESLAFGVVRAQVLEELAAGLEHRCDSATQPQLPRAEQLTPKLAWLRRTHTSEASRLGHVTYWKLGMSRPDPDILGSWYVT